MVITAINNDSHIIDYVWVNLGNLSYVSVQFNNLNYPNFYSTSKYNAAAPDANTAPGPPRSPPTASAEATVIM